MTRLIPSFRPALLRSLKGYDGARFARDLAAGLVVGIVAIPLALAFAIASGVAPEAGLVTAVVAGLLISAFGGSRVTVGGPTGAFVVIVYGVVQTHGVGGLIVATFMAGIILVLFGVARLGRLIQFIPFPVVTGFTAGIGAIILFGQLKEILGYRGIDLPDETLPRLAALAGNLAHVNPWSLGLALGTIGVIVLVKRFVPKVPGPVLALVAFTGLAVTLGAPSETIGDRFGALPKGLPPIRLPELSFSTITRLLPSALTIALLGAIESLLCAVVADGMIEDKHDSDQELVAQGIANMGSALFGGIPATGAIARTATNVQNGGTTPVAGIVHAAVVGGFVLFLAPLASVIPLAVLGGILAVVAWNMADVNRFRRLLRMPLPDAAVLLATFLLTVLVDLVVAVEVGMVLAAFLFMHRMSRAASLSVIDPEADVHYRQNSIAGKDVPAGVTIYSIDGPFFFGAAESFQRTLERVAKPPPVMIFRMRHAPYLDATGLSALEGMVRRLRKRGTTVILSAVQNQPLDLMMRSGFLRLVGDENLQPDIDRALARARTVLSDPGLAGPSLPPAAEGGH